MERKKTRIGKGITVWEYSVACAKMRKKYTLEPKFNTYPEEIRKCALKIYYSGVSGRSVGKILGMSKANVVRGINKRQN